MLSKIVSKLPWTFFWMLIFFFRNGVNFQNPSPILMETVTDFPNPVSYASSNILPISLLNIFNIQTIDSWAIFFGTLNFSLVFITFVSIQLKGNELKNFYSVLVVVAPISTLLAGNIGLMDYFLCLSWCLFFFGPKRINTFSALLVSLSSPEQALVSFLAITVLERSVGKSLTGRNTKFFIVQSFCIVIASNLWLLFNHVPARSWLLVRNFVYSIGSFVRDFPNLFLSGYGPFWILVLLFIFRLQKNSKYYAAVSLILIPTLFTLFTLDGSRVFILITFPLVLMCIRELMDLPNVRQNVLRNQLIIVLASLSFPPLIIYGGDYYRPFDNFLFNSVFSRIGFEWSETIDQFQIILGSAF